jgi:hypothetical protein
MTINQRALRSAAALPMITSTVVGIAVLSVDIAINAGHPGDHLDLRSPRLRPFCGIARFTAVRDNPPRRAVGECTPGRGDKAIGLRYGSKHGSDWDCWTVWLRNGVAAIISADAAKPCRPPEYNPVPALAKVLERPTTSQRILTSFVRIALKYSN